MGHVWDGEQASALAELPALLLSTESAEDFLSLLAGLAVRVVDPVRLSCGITVQLDGHPLTVVSSDWTAMQLDEVQHGNGDGPCLQALRSGEAVYIPDLLPENRWDEYRSRALSQGIWSSLSLPMTLSDDTLGAMNLYAPSQGAFGEAEQGRAKVLASQAGGAVGLIQRLRASETLVDNLETALASRTVIARAEGIVMARQRCGAEEAFAWLRSTSQHRNVKLRDIAAEIVAEVSGESPPHDAVPG